MSIRTNFYPDGTTVNTAADFIAPWAAMLSDGVFGATDFAASADSPADLAVSVAIGRAIKDGHFIRSDAAEHVPISANTSGYNRIDTIVLQVDDTGNLTTLAVAQGTPSSSPTAPILQANQLPLAQVMVGNNVSVIDSSAITDIRALTSVKPPNAAALQSTDGKFILPSGLKIQWATSDILTNYDNSNVCHAGITFDISYTQLPIVIPIIVRAGNTAEELAWVPRASGISTTECTIYVYDNGGHFNAGFRPWVRWIAIGY